MGADVADVAIYIYCYVVRTPWEQAMWLNQAEEKKVRLDTPQTTMTTRAPAVLKIHLFTSHRVPLKEQNFLSEINQGGISSATNRENEI